MEYFSKSLPESMRPYFCNISFYINLQRVFRGIFRNNWYFFMYIIQCLEGNLPLMSLGNAMTFNIMNITTLRELLCHLMHNHYNKLFFSTRGHNCSRTEKKCLAVYFSHDKQHQSSKVSLQYSVLFQISI